MVIRVQPLAISGVSLVETTSHHDDRGSFSETYSQRDFAAVGITTEFVQDNHSVSVTAGTLRGLHFQTPPHAQAKLVRVLRGAIWDVAVDLRTGSPTYGQHVAVSLSAGDGLQLFVPVGFAHGFVTLEPHTEVAYKVSAYYSRDCDRGVSWDDPELGIAWPIDGLALAVSAKDRAQPRLAELEPVFDYQGQRV